MRRVPIPRSLALFFCIAGAFNGHSQLGLDYKINQVAETCTRGIASLEIAGLQSGDLVTTRWSSGDVNTMQVTGLSGGDHNVSIHVERKSGTHSIAKDTLISFNLEKQDCPVSVPKYFSPNDDAFNDLLVIGNLDHYPDFELDVYDKWGQRVHMQKHSYEPWNGKWLGVDLPDGTYYYVLFFDVSNRNRLMKGDITILR